MRQTKFDRLQQARRAMENRRAARRKAKRQELERGQYDEEDLPLLWFLLMPETIIATAVVVLVVAYVIGTIIR